MAMDTSRLIPNNKELTEAYEPASIAHIGINKKIKDRIANEGIGADSPKVGSLIEDAHKELKASGFEMVDYVSDAHEGHEIDGFKARKGDRAGTRAAWQHPGTGQIKQFDADPDTMDISTLKNTSPDFLDKGSGASEELYEKGRTAARSGTRELSVERKAAQAAKQEENKKYQEQLDKIQQEETAKGKASRAGLEGTKPSEMAASQPAAAATPTSASTPSAPASTSAPAATARIEDFKDPNKFFRVIRGEEAFNDIVESGQVRNKPPVPGVVGGQINLDNRPTAFPSFAKGEVSMSYAQGEDNHYVISSSDPSIKPSTHGRHGKGTTHFPTDETGKPVSSLDASKVDVYRHIGDGNYELAHTGGKPVTSAATAASAAPAPAPSAIESAVESATNNAPATQPAASQSAAAPEKTLNRAQKKALEAQQKRAAAAAQATAAPPSAVQSAVESATENAPEARPAAAAALEPPAAPQEAKLAQGAEEVAQAASTGAPIPQPVSVEKQPLEVRRSTYEEAIGDNEKLANRTTSHPDWENPRASQVAMSRDAELAQIDEFEARGQKHPFLYTDDDWNELYSKEDEATREVYKNYDEFTRNKGPSVQAARNQSTSPVSDADQKLYDDFEASQQRVRGSDPDFYVDEDGVAQEGKAARAASVGAEATEEVVDDASTAAPKAGATASKGAKITTGAQAARTGANGMRNSIVSKITGGRRFNMDIVDRQLDLTTRGMAGTLSSVINDYGLNRREAVGGGHMDTLFGKAIRTGGKRVSWASAEYAAPVFNAAEKEAKWATFKTAEEAAESWADEIEGSAARGGPLNKVRAGFYRLLGGRGSAANKMMTKLGGFGSAMPVAFNLLGVAMGAREGYREGGLGGAMKGGAKGLVTNAVHGQMIGAALSHPLLMLGGASLMMASYKVGHGIFDVRTKGNNYLKMGRAGGLSWNTGSTPGMDSQVASTMRGRALMSMENSRFNAMKSLGNESYMMTSPSARYANSTQLGSQQPMLAY